MTGKITVGMDISQLAHQGGVATYTQNLAAKLSEVSDLEMVYFYSSLRQFYKGSLENVKSFRFPPSIFEILFNRLRSISIEKFIGQIDIFHSSDWIQPPTKAKKVTTYHDVVPLKYPAWSHPKIVSVHKRRLRLVEKEIDCVIAVSESTKRDLLEVSQIPESKITVVYEAPTADFKPQLPEKIKGFKEKYKLPDKFILAIGGIGERRNLARIKEACRDYPLVIAGHTLSWLSISELELLYNSAQLLLYPSLYEGFGLPILDAQACGCPVVTSNVSAMPEVARKGAILVDPYSTEDIIRGISEVREVREKLIKRGLENVKRFSWEKAAQQTAQIYRTLVNSSDKT